MKTLHLVGACLFLASKVLEQPRRLESVCSKLYSIHTNKKLKKTANLQFPPISTNILHALKESVIFHEFLILETIGFNVKVKLCYKHIAKLVGNLGITTSFKNSLIRMANRFANDFYRTSAALVKDKATIAESCIFLAAKAFKFELGVEPDLETLEIFNFEAKIECIL